MKYLSCCLSVLIVSLALLPSEFPAYADMSESTQKFAISGSSAEELQSQLKQRFEDNADTTWKVKWRFMGEITSGACTVRRVATSLDVRYIVPEWTDAPLAHSRLQANWRKYLDTLRLHQKGHRDIGSKATFGLERTVVGMSARDCATLKEAVDAAANEVVLRYKQIDQDYDAESGGAILGARLK